MMGPPKKQGIPRGRPLPGEPQANQQPQKPQQKQTPQKQTALAKQAPRGLPFKKPTNQRHQKKASLGTVEERFLLKEMVGLGGFGEVFKAEDLQTGRKDVVVKIEQMVDNDPGILLYEAKILSYLSQSSCLGTPQVFSFGPVPSGSYRYLAMADCGHPLSAFFSLCGGKLDQKTVMVVAMRFIDILETVHDRFILHRDMKPENMMYDAKTKTFYLIDYGLSKRYIDKSGTHLPRLNNKTFRGTLRYCTLNMHNGVENSRRDDLESLGYVLLYLVRGKLPWMRIKVDGFLITG